MISYVWYKILTKLKGRAIRESQISADAKVEAGSIVQRTKMGRFSYCGYNCILSNVEIGSFCSLSDSIVIGGGKHPLDWASTSPAFYKGRDSISKRLAKLDYDYRDERTVIGNDVWIGHGAYIKPGLVIGDGAVIGMGSIVTKDVSPYSIVAGNPAREIRKRFDDDLTEELLRLKWWNLSEKELFNVSEYFDNARMLVQKLKGEKNVSIDRDMG